MTLYNDEHLYKIRKYPHLIGLLAGKDKLTPLHSEWIKYIWDSKEHRGLQGHRGSFKTTACTIVGVPWWLLFHPDDRIAIIRKTSTDAEDVINTIKNIMLLPEIQALFHFAHGIVPDATINRGTKVVYNFKGNDTPEGSIDGYGIGTNITGKHYDKILCDDIVSFVDRYSKAERERTKRSLQEIVTNIIDPGKQVMHTGTPWHIDDAWSLTDTIAEGLKYDCYSTNILTPEEIHLKRKGTTESMFACNYELKHILDDSCLFDEPTFTNWIYTQTKTKGHIDAKYDGSDTNALTFMYTKPDGRIQAIGYTFTENIKDKYDFVISKYQLHHCSELHCETNADKGFLADKLRESGCRVKTYHEKMNKHMKITTYLVDKWDIIDWDPRTDADYMKQIIEYREGLGHDDCPDSASSLLREAFKKTNTELGAW